jgi:hypothetical protein
MCSMGKKCCLFECAADQARLLMRLAKVEAERDMLLAGEIPPHIIAKSVGAVGHHAQLYEGYIARQKKKSIFSWFKKCF